MPNPLIDAIVAAEQFGRASAAKRGRNPSFPYVPVIDHSDERRTRTEQILGKAFATRSEAIEYATKVIEHRRETLYINLLDPRYRALRSSYGLFCDLPPARVNPEMSAQQFADMRNGKGEYA